MIRISGKQTSQSVSPIKHSFAKNTAQHADSRWKRVEYQQIYPAQHPFLVLPQSHPTPPPPALPIMISHFVHSVLLHRSTATEAVCPNYSMFSLWDRVHSIRSGVKQFCGFQTWVEADEELVTGNVFGYLVTHHNCTWVWSI